MDKRIFPDLSGRELIENLEANADDAEDRTYYVPLSEEEIIELKDKFANLSIKLAKIEERKKMAMDEFKLEMAPLIEEKGIILNEIKMGAREEEGIVFKFVDYDQAMVGFYNQQGILVDSRPAMQDERRQLTISSARRTGTSD